MPVDEATDIRLRHLEQNMMSMRSDFNDKVDRMERRTISAMSDFSVKLSSIESKLGKVMLIVVALAAAGGASGMRVIQALIGVM